eukprot:EG_transcript_9910
MSVARASATGAGPAAHSAASSSAALVSQDTIASRLRRTRTQLAQQVERMPAEEFRALVATAPPGLFGPDRQPEDPPRGDRGYDAVHVTEHDRQRLIGREMARWQQLAEANQAADTRLSPLLAIPRAAFLRLVLETIDLVTLIHCPTNPPYRVSAHHHTDPAGRRHRTIRVQVEEDRERFLITQAALDMLQYVAEDDLIQLFSGAQVAALHARRNTVTAHDMQVARWFGGPQRPLWEEPRRTRLQELLIDNFYQHQEQANWLAAAQKEKEARDKRRATPPPPPPPPPPKPAPQPHRHPAAALSANQRPLPLTQTPPPPPPKTPPPPAGPRPPARSLPARPAAASAPAPARPSASSARPPRPPAAAASPAPTPKRGPAAVKRPATRPTPSPSSKRRRR